MDGVTWLPHRSLVLLVVALLMLHAAGTTVTIPAHTTTSAGPDLTYSTHTAFGTTAYVANVSNPRAHFRVLYPKLANSSCGGYTKPSVIARVENCLYATNGGPFIMGKGPDAATCLGDIVSDSVTVQTVPTGASANFGLTKEGNFVLGELEPKSIGGMDFEQLLTGFGWLLFNGSIQVGPGGEVAPRTALGVTPDGRLLIFQADGIERSQPPQGLTLYQTAQWLSLLGAFHAVNLDGGGSSTTVYQGQIVNFPTCTDQPHVKCERSVTTVTCIMP